MDSMLPPSHEVPSSVPLGAASQVNARGTAPKPQRRRQGNNKAQQSDSPADPSSGTAASTSTTSPRSRRVAKSDVEGSAPGTLDDSTSVSAGATAGGALAGEEEGTRSAEEVDGKKMFQCKGFGSCRMSFSRSEHLARHIRKHTGERPFKCHCGRDFSRLDNLRQHAQTVHSDQADKNAEMMQRLQSVHTALSASNRAKRAKTSASNVNQSHRVGTNPSPPPPAMAPLPVNATAPPQPMHSGAPYYNPVPTEFAPQDYGMRHQMMDPYYDHEGYPSYALYPADFNMPGRPTLPPISALIPRQGVSAPQQNPALLPSPLPPSAQIYAGHTSPVYAYPEPVSASPRSAGPDGHPSASAAAAGPVMGGAHPQHAYHAGTPSPISPSRMSHHQAQHHAPPQPILHMDEYGNSYYAMPPGLPGLEEQPGSPFVHAPPQAADPDSQHGGINDLLHAATTAVTPGMPNAEYFSGPPPHAGPPMRASVSPMPASHYGTPTASPGPHAHQQRRMSPGKRPRQEGEAEYLEQLNESGAYFKRPMLATV